MGEQDRADSRWRAGDPESFEVLVKRHGPALLAYVRGLVRDRDLAEDIIQQTFLQLWRSARKPERYAGWQASFSTLAHIAARRLAWNALSRDRLRPAGDAQQHLSDGGADPAERVLRDERARRALRLVGELPVEEREALVLKAQEGKSYREIAEITGLTLDQVRGRIASAYRKLLSGLGGP